MSSMMDKIRGIFRYACRLLRVLRLLAKRTISFRSFLQSLRPAQVSVTAREGKMIFCDRDTERMAFGE